MCISDWRLGKLMRPKFTTFTWTAGAVTLAAADPNRVLINFVLLNGAVATSQFLNFGPDGNEVFSLDSVVRFFRCGMDEFGDLPTRAWSGTYNGTNHSGAMVEWFLPAEYLAEPLNQYESNYLDSLRRR